MFGICDVLLLPVSRIDWTLYVLFCSAEVRAYLLKPSSDPGVCKLELSEIRPADQAETDLDVRLTLVGTEVGTEDDAENDGEDYLVGEGRLEGDEVEGEPGATGARWVMCCPRAFYVT